jgi:glucose/arabinose dehydrogenase
VKAALRRAAPLLALLLAITAVAVAAVASALPARSSRTTAFVFQPAAGRLGGLEWQRDGEAIGHEAIDSDAAVALSTTRRTVELELLPLGQSDDASQGLQVWFEEANGDGGPSGPPDRLPAGWVVRYDTVTERSYFLAEGAAAPLQVNLEITAPDVRLTYLANPYGGLVQVRADGQVLGVLDTYDEAIVRRAVSMRFRPGVDDRSTWSTARTPADATDLRWHPSDTPGMVRIESISIGGWRWEAGDSVRMGPGILADDGDPTRFTVIDPPTAWLDFGGITDPPSGVASLPRRPLAVALGASAVAAGLAVVGLGASPSGRPRDRRVTVGVPLIVAVGAAATLPVAWRAGGGTIDEVDRSDDFELVTEIDGLDNPVAMAFGPDGTIFVIEKGGFEEEGVGRVLRLTEDGPVVVLEVPVCASAERGLLGIALDPAFADNGHFYLDYTSPDEGCAVGAGSATTNRVSRFTLDGSAADPASEAILVDGLPAADSAHVAGGLRIAPDGTLFVGVGEGIREERPSRDLAAFGGKILRITLDPQAIAPTDNPYASSDDPVQQLVYASGFRNPFRFSVDPTTGSVLVGDVGSEPPRAAEELNVVYAGGDYGWPDQEGLEAPPPGAELPAWTYDHDVACNTIIGGPVLTTARYGDDLRGHVLVADFSCGRMWAVHIEGGSADRVVEVLAPEGDEAATIVDVVEGPDGVVYVVDIAGTIMRLEQVG